MSVPQQNITKAPIDPTSLIGKTVTVYFTKTKFKFQGELENNIIKGSINQSGNSLPLTLKKGAFLSLQRPQEPKPPFPYYTEDISFYNTTDNITLKGTLSLPQKKGKYPAAIIISSSGPQDRDGLVYGHKPYLLLADYLTRNGVAVLRFDERGVGKSEGTFKTASLTDFSTDVEAALSFLKERKEINNSKIGLIGHSIGGIIAPKMAAQDKTIAYVVMMVGPGINGDELLLLQKAAFERLSGLPEATIKQSQDFAKDGYNIITKSSLQNDLLKDSISDFYQKKYGALVPEKQLEVLVSSITSPEVVGLLRAKPNDYLSKVTSPILAINGSKDFQVTPKENLAAIRAIFEKNGNKNSKAIELENLNHLFQECKIGSLQEYSELEQTMSPKAL